MEGQNNNTSIESINSQEINSEKINDKSENTHDEVVYDDVDEDIDDDSNDDQSDGSDSDKETDRINFSSPEAAAERLEKIPSQVLDDFKNINMNSMFHSYILELHKRCNDLRDNEDSYSYKRMWIQGTLTVCNDFYHNILYSKDIILGEDPEAFKAYMKERTEVEILQLFIDVSQRVGFSVRKELKLATSEGSKSTKKEIDALHKRCVESRRRYYSFVRLFKKCTGSWKPTRRNTFFTPASADQARQNRHPFMRDNEFRNRRHFHRQIPSRRSDERGTYTFNSHQDKRRRNSNRGRHTNK